MKRSTKMAPVSLSTSYFTGSAFMGISMITLKASGACLPGATLSRDMVFVSKKQRNRASNNPYFNFQRLLSHRCREFVTSFRLYCDGWQIVSTPPPGGYEEATQRRHRSRGASSTLLISKT